MSLAGILAETANIHHRSLDGIIAARRHGSALSRFVLIETVAWRASWRW